MPQLLDIQSSDFREVVAKADKPVVVEYWHHKCPMCLRMEPFYKQLPEKIGDRAQITRMNLLDSKENRTFAINEGVRATPTIKVYCQGRSVGELVGFRNLNRLIEDLIQIVNSANYCLDGSTPLS